VFLLSVGWIILASPGRWATLGLILVAAVSAGAFVMLFLPEPLSPAVRNALAAAGICATLIIAYLAIPGFHSEESESPISLTRSGNDPFTWDIVPNNFCEGFVVNNSLLKSVPRGKKLNAEWAYKKEGATANFMMNLVLQGDTDDAVVLHGLHLIDVHIDDIPAEASEIYPCNLGGGPVDYRVFDVVLDKHPRLIQRPGRDDTGKTADPIKEFPYKISNEEIEYITLRFGTKGRARIGSFRLALDWTSKGRSGTTIIERKFGSSIRVRVGSSTGMGHYERNTENGQWDPPLPG
jgi:hypothetical protein